MGLVLARYRNRNVFGDRPSAGLGKRLFQVIFGLIILVVVGGVAYLGLGEYAPDRQLIERTIDVDTTRQ